MGAANQSALAAYRRELADQLRTQGAVRSDPIHAAFCAVARHLFVPVAYRDGGDTAVAYPISENDAATMRRTYQDRTLVTEVDAAGRPVSSSTAPSVMGFMLEALALRPGHRVLEIGCGTGYNAALIHNVTGTDVISVDPNRTVVFRARAALRCHGIRGVACLIADGYHGMPSAAPFDRIIATCAVAGISPMWLKQCTAHWRMVVPLAHGGIDMLAVIRPGEDGPTAHPTGGAGYFMSAEGPLFPYRSRSAMTFCRTDVEVAAPVPDFRHGYHDLWFTIANQDNRVDLVRGAGLDGRLGQCGLSDRDGAAALQIDGFIRACGRNGTRLANAAAVLLHRWWDAGRPRARSWSSTLCVDNQLVPPLLVPRGWCRSPHRCAPS